MNCALCDEPMGNALSSNANLLEPMHRECSLREVMGGIGHLIAHEYWCLEFHDPDAGLSRRESSLMVDFYVNLVGVERAVEASAWPSDQSE